MIATTTRRVPANTAPEINERIRQETEKNIAYYSQQGRKAIDRRLEELDQEWDVERVLQTNAAGAVLISVFMGVVSSRKWFLFPGFVGGFLLQHALSGWCPPLPILRRLGFRTSHEIEHERHALLNARESE